MEKNSIALVDLPGMAHFPFVMQNTTTQAIATTAAKIIAILNHGEAPTELDLHEQVDIDCHVANLGFMREGFPSGIWPMHACLDDYLKMFRSKVLHVVLCSVVCAAPTTYQARLTAALAMDTVKDAADRAIDFFRGCGFVPMRQQLLDRVSLESHDLNQVEFDAASRIVESKITHMI